MWYVLTPNLTIPSPGMGRLREAYGNRMPATVATVRVPLIHNAGDILLIPPDCFMTVVFGRSVLAALKLCLVV